MKIAEFKVYQYTLPLARPLVVHGLQLSTRRGMILQLISNKGEEGFGEISPLPALSKESFEIASKQILSLQDFLTNNNVPSGIERLNGGFKKWFKNLRLVPSVQFGIEMAVLNLIANSKKVPLHKIISEEFHTNVRITGLISGSKETVKTQTAELLAKGFVDLKLKVGEHIEDEIEKVRIVNETINGKALLHLDANQTWDYEEAVRFGEEVGLAAMDYIEEPFRDIDRIPEFFNKTTIPVALDETLQTLDFEKLKSVEGVDVLVLKPTVIGGIEKVWQIIQTARNYAIDIVVSSSFESDIGLLTLVNLAGAYTSRDRAAGLDTGKWFENNLLRQNLEIKGGKIDISNRMIRSHDIHFDQLKQIL